MIISAVSAVSRRHPWEARFTAPVAVMVTKPLGDRRGVIRHVHLGGNLAPDTDDFRVMRAKVLLAVNP